MSRDNFSLFEKLDFLGGDPAPPPKTYIELEYLTGTGAQYTDLGFTLDIDDTFIIKASTTVLTTTQFLFGRRGGYTQPTAMYVALDGARRSMVAGNGSAIPVWSPLVVVNDPFEIEVTPDNWSYNGVVVAEFTGTQSPSGLNAVIGGVMDGSGVSTLRWKGNIYPLQVVGKHDIIPVVWNDTNEVGWYDKMTGIFLPSSTSTPWIAGPIKRPFPDWVYEMGTPVWGLKNPSTAYIKTGVTFKSSKQKKVITMSSPVDIGSLQVANGSQNGTNRSPYLGYLNGNVRIGFGGQSASNSPYTFPLKQEPVTYTIETFEDGTAKFEGDGIVHSATWNNSVITGLEEYLFRLNYTGTYYSKSIILAYQCWDDGVRVINYQPLVRKDGEVGMVDLDTREFYRSFTNTLFEAVLEADIAQSLMELGIEPTSDTNENIKMLNEMGVRL